MNKADKGGKDKNLIRKKRTPGEIVAARRKELGWTQEELEWRSSVSTTHISRIENDQTRPGIGTIVKLEDTLGIPLMDIFMDFRKETDVEKKSYLAQTDTLKRFERDLAKSGLSGKELQDVLNRILAEAESRQKNGESDEEKPEEDEKNP